MGRTGPEVGTLTADGSRVWDGRYWVLNPAGHRLDALPPLEERRQAAEFSSDRLRYRLWGVVLAALVGLTIIFIPIPAPSPGSLDSALTELAIVSLLRLLLTFVMVVVILSIGRQGIDVLLLRTMLTVFLMGAAVAALYIDLLVSIPIPVTSRIPVPWPLLVVLTGLFLAVQFGPVLAVVSALANLLWYRSLRSLGAQLGIFFRLVLAGALAINILISLWVTVFEHNFGLWLLGGGPAVAMVVLVFLLRRSGGRIQKLG